MYLTRNLNKVVPFQLSAGDAEKLSHIPSLRQHNLDISPEDAAPFTLGMMTHYPPGCRSRFNLPILSFRGEPVAALGFRNKDGFLMMRPDLPEQVESAVVTRMRGVMSATKRNLRALREEEQALEDKAQAILHAHGEPLNEMDGVEIWRGVSRMLIPRPQIGARLKPCQIFNRLKLSLGPEADLFIKGNGNWCFRLRRPDFNLSRELVSFTSFQAGSSLTAHDGEAGLVLRCISAGERMLTAGMNPDEMLAEMAEVEPLGQDEIEKMNQFLVAALRAPSEHRPVGRYSISPEALGPCLMRDGLIVMQARSRHMALSPDASSALKRCLTASGRMSRILLTAAGVISPPEHARAPKGGREWRESLEEAVRSTDFGYA